MQSHLNNITTIISEECNIGQIEKWGLHIIFQLAKHKMLKQKEEQLKFLFLLISIFFFKN